MAAPAQPAAPQPTISAERAASDAGDFSSFDRAHTAAKRGAPMESVTAPEKPAAPAKAVAAAPAPADTPNEPAQTERQVSKRQQAINDYERRIAEQDQRIRALESQVTRPAAAQAQPEQPPPAKDPDWKRYRAMPDAPQLNDFDTLEDFQTATAVFVADKRAEERVAAQSEQQSASRREAFQRERAETFSTNLRAAAEADEAFVSRINPALLEARPASALAKGERVTFANVAAEVAFTHSDDAATFYDYLSAHPEEATAITRLHPSQWMPALLRLDGRLAGQKPPSPAPPPAQAAAPQPLPISSAPKPPPSLNRAGSTVDPEKAALARGDVSAFLKADLDKRLAARGMR